MATERISFLARSDDDDCKLGDNVKLWFGDGSDGADGDLLLLTTVAGHTITVDDANINLGAATRAVAPGGSLLLRYDGVEDQWTEVAFLAAADNA